MLENASGRLIWKEAREAAAIMLLMLALPAVSIPLQNKGFEGINGVLSTIGTLGILTSIFLPAMWGAMKGDEMRQVKSFARTHLPVNPSISVATTALIAVFAVACSSLAFFLLMKHTHPEIVDGALKSTMLVLLSLFFAGFISGATVHKWAAMAIMALYALYSTIILMNNQLGSLSTNEIYSAKLMIGASIAAIILVATLLRNSGWLLSRAVPFAAVAAVAFSPFAPNSADLLKAAYKYLIVGQNRYSYRTDVDQAFDIVGTPVFRILPGERESTVQHFYNGKIARNIRLDKQAHIIGINKSVLYIAAKKPGDVALEILAWNADDGSLKKAATLPSRALSFPYHQSFVGVINSSSYSVSPNGRYLLTVQLALRGGGFDLWAIDLETGKRYLLLPSVSYLIYFDNKYAVWTEKQLFIGGRGIIIYDLPNFRLNEKSIDVRGGERWLD